MTDFPETSVSTANRRRKVIFLWLLVGSIFLAISGFWLLCGAPASTPAPRAVLLPTDTNTLTPTLTPTSTPTTRPTQIVVLPHPPTIEPTWQPQAAPEAFRLKHLSEQELAQVYNTARVDKALQKYEGDYNFQQESLIYEIFLRFPQRRADKDLRFQLAKLEYYTDDWSYAFLHGASTETFRQLMEDGLNHAEIEPDILTDWAKQFGITFVQPVLKSDNLFTGHRSAFILQTNFGQLFIIRQKAPNLYAVIALEPRWYNNPRTKTNTQILDINGNGQDEIAVTGDIWGPGMAGWSDKAFMLYEWDGKAFQNLLAEPLVLEAWGNTRILKPEIAIDSEGVQTITARTFRSIGCKEFYGYVNQTLYRLDGKVFKKTRSEVLPLRNDTPASCALVWATIAGPEDDRAVAILRGLLENWPPAINDEKGPASQDYYRLVYGLWLLRRGDTETGLAQFQTVYKQPTAPEYPWPKKLAGEFLANYASGGLLKAVAAFQLTLKTEFKSWETEPIYLDAQKMIPRFGFYDGDEVWVHVAVYLGQFSPELFIEQALQQTNINNQDDLVNWLEKSGLAYELPHQGDLNGDGVDDWLVEIGWGGEWWNDENDMELYAFLREDSKVTPVQLLPSVQKGDSATLQSFRPTPSADLVHVMKYAKGVLAFRIIKKENGWKLVDDVYSPNYDFEQNRSLINWKIANCPGGKCLEINYDGSQGIYAWDAVQRQLVPTGYSPELQLNFCSTLTLE
jgi:hypothetical protein